MAWHPLGWTPAFFAEIEKFPSQVLAHYYGSNMPGEELSANGVPNLGDISKFQEWPDATIDLLVGGTPCQAFSVAGLRKGLADPRGNLSLTYLGILDRYRPRWCVWENVPGVLSLDEGRAFGSILGGLAELGYGFAYRILDAQFVRVDGLGRAVPQRRRRVFVVGYLGDWRRAAAVLFEPESLSGNSAPSRETGEGVAPTISARPTGGGGLGTDFDLDGGLLGFGGNNCSGPIEAAASLAAHGGPAGRLDFASETFIATRDVAATLTRGAESSGKGGYAGRRQEDDDNLVAHSLRAEGFDASEDGTGRGTPLVPVSYGISRDALDRSGEGEGGTAGERAGLGIVEGISPTLKAKGANAVATPYTLAIRGRDGEPDLEYRQDGTANAVLTPNGGRAGIGVGAVAIQAGAMRENPERGPDGVGVQADIAYTLEARAEVQAVQERWAVRRLMPIECERLQGFPQIQKTYKIQLCQSYPDHQKHDARAARQCHKSPSNVWIADAGGWTLSASAAESYFSTRHHDQGPLVALDALIDLERNAVHLHSPGRFRSPVLIADGRSEFPLPTGIESFAHLAALTTQLWERTIQTGRAALHPNTPPSTAHWNGSDTVAVFGREIGANAESAAESINTAKRLTTSTTSLSGQDIPTCVSTLRTLSCCVVHAIAGYIPETTSAANSFGVRLTTFNGYTNIPWRGKETAPDGPRYKALGNSMAVNVMRWIGQRIELVDRIASEQMREAAE